jgi:integrase/recombinase XerC
MQKQTATYLKSSASPVSSTPLAMAAQSFYLSREAMRCTPATLVWYHKYVSALIGYLTEQGLKDLASITSDYLRAFLVQLQNRGLADTTIHHHASAARTFFNYLVEEGLLTASPMRKVKMPRMDNDIPPAFTAEEVRKLLKAVELTRDTAMLLCLLDSGCRSAEFVALNVGDVDLASGAVTVKQGKGRKDRTTFVGAKARKALLRYLMARGNPGRNEPLWTNELTGERLTDSGLRQALTEIAKRAKVDNCHPHTFRRTCALFSLRAGMNIYALQKMMGHADLTILRRYLALVEQDVQEAHRQHGAVDNML